MYNKYFLVLTLPPMAKKTHNNNTFTYNCLQSWS